MTVKRNIQAIESQIVRVLKNIHDPEIPVNIYDLGLIYSVEVDDDGLAQVEMTLTAPNCPMADQLLEEVHTRIAEVNGVTDVMVELTFDPPWDKGMMSKEAMLDLGFL